MPGVMVAGESEQLIPVGAVHESVIAPLKPPVPVELTVTEAEPPAASDTVCVDRESEKFAPPAWFATMAANSPDV